MNIIFGAGGVARELTWILSDISETGCANMLPNGYVSADNDAHGSRTIEGLNVWPEHGFLESIQKKDNIENVFIAIGDPKTRDIVERHVSKILNCRFPHVIHPKAAFDRKPGSVKIGCGSILYPNACLTTSINIGKFVQVNPCATIGHEAYIGDFTTICPGAHISGNARIGSRCFIGAGAIIRERVTVADDCYIGAGAVVIRDINESGTWVGIPARRIR